MRGFIPARIVRALTALRVKAAEVGHYDFCPWANRYVYWLKQPIGWLAAGALASLLVALVVAPQAWFVFGALMAVMMLGVAWPWISMHGLEASLAFDRKRCHELEAVAMHLTVRNRWPWPAWGLVVERGFFESEDPTDPTAAVTALARVPGWSQSEYGFMFRPERRGIYPQAPPVLATGFPFGIWIRTRPIPTCNRLIAWPQTVPLTSVPVIGGNLLTVAGSPIDRAGDDGDILAARFYREGDSLRRIHWAQTARRDTLIVCERQTTARRRVIAVLDGAAFGGSSPADHRRLDWAVRVYASVCRELHAHHLDVECRWDGVSFCMPPGPVGLHRMLDRLAEYRPEPAGEVRGSLGVSGLDSLVLLITRDQRSAMRFAPASGIGKFRSILVDDRVAVVSGIRDPSAGRAVRAWISLDSSTDVAGQLQHQWGKRCHDNGRNN